MRWRLLLLLATTLLLVGGAGVAVAGSTPELSAHGPTEVAGTEATAVFRIGSRTIRQIRYADRETLTYSFALSNDGRLPVKITGLAPVETQPRLFRFIDITDASGHTNFTIGAGERRVVRVSMLMHACETLSSRAGSFASRVNLATSRAGVLDDAVTVVFPEEVHTGSPREAFCPRATASSRPPG